MKSIIYKLHVKDPEKQVDLPYFATSKDLLEYILNNKQDILGDNCVDIHITLNTINLLIRRTEKKNSNVLKVLNRCFDIESVKVSELLEKFDEEHELVEYLENNIFSSDSGKRFIANVRKSFPEKPQKVLEEVEKPVSIRDILETISQRLDDIEEQLKKSRIVSKKIKK